MPHITPTLGAIALVASLLASALPIAAAESDPPRCYHEACDWDRVAEEQLRAHVEAHATGRATPGALYTAPIDDLRDAGRLRVLTNATRDNVTYEILVVRDYGCGALARIEDLALPGYAGAITALGNASGIAVANGTHEIRACGELRAGIPAGSGATRGGGTLRLQTGALANVTTRPGGADVVFPLWVGVTLEDTLSVTRLAEGAYAIDTTVTLSLVVLGDLGYGNGDVRVDLIPQWTRSIVAARAGCCASANDATLGEPRPDLAALAPVEDAAAPWLADQTPRRYCGAIQDRESRTCALVGLTTALPAIGSDRATSAWRAAPRFAPEAHAAAEYVGLCSGVGSECVFAPGGASGVKLGSKSVVVVDRTEPWTFGPGGSVDQRANAEISRFDPEGISPDLVAWFGSLS